MTESQNSNYKPSEEDIKKGLRFYARYSGLAFQMLGMIFIGIFGGLKLDQLVSLGFPLFTVLFSLLSVFGAIYFAVKGLIKSKKND